jgi:hypothetical protein
MREIPAIDCIMRGALTCLQNNVAINKAVLKKKRPPLSKAADILK